MLTGDKCYGENKWSYGKLSQGCQSEGQGRHNFLIVAGFLQSDSLAKLEGAERVIYPSVWGSTITSMTEQHEEGSGRNERSGRAISAIVIIWSHFIAVDS